MPELVEGKQNILIGNPRACYACGATVRVTYLIKRDKYFVIEDGADVASGRLIAHECPERPARTLGGERR